jgi:hypothetical protein
MAIQIKGEQIQNTTIEPGKLVISSQTYDFSSGTLRASTPSASSDVATKAYVDGQLPDSFSGGDGISIDTSGDPDVIAVDLATNPGLQFTSNKLDVKVKTESGGSITKDADGLYIADSAIGNAKLAGSIANAKLANSTISGVALGSNLNALSAGNGLSMSSYNGSAAVSDLTIDLDGATLAVGASGIKVADAGVDTGQLADSSVETAKINNLAVSTAKIADAAISTAKLADSSVDTAKLADSSVSAAKVSFSSQIDPLTGNGSTTAFDLSSAIDDAFAVIIVFRNGLAIEQVASSPSGVDQFSLSLNGGTGGVAQVTFGSAPASSDNLRVFYIA